MLKILKYLPITFYCGVFLILTGCTNLSSQPTENPNPFIWPTQAQPYTIDQTSKTHSTSNTSTQSSSNTIEKNTPNGQASHTSTSSDTKTTGSSTTKTTTIVTPG